MTNTFDIGFIFMVIDRRIIVFFRTRCIDESPDLQARCKVDHRYARPIVTESKRAKLLGMQMRVFNRTRIANYLSSMEFGTVSDIRKQLPLGSFHLIIFITAAY